MPGPDSILHGVRDRYAASTDFTVGLEEEYQLLDPSTFALVQRFEELIDAAPPELAPHLAGELIASEIEYRTNPHGRFADAALDLIQGRLAVAQLLEDHGMAIGLTGCHPFSTWQEQRIIDTPHYRRVEGELGYIAWINNTWSQHIHVGINDADRAIAICTAMRSVLPELLALCDRVLVMAEGRLTANIARADATQESIMSAAVPRTLTQAVAA